MCVEWFSFLCVSNGNFGTGSMQVEPARIEGSKKQNAYIQWAYCSIALEMRQYLTDCAAPYLCHFSENESNKSPKIHILSVAISFISFGALFFFSADENISAYNFSVSLAKMLRYFSSLGFKLGVELSSMSNTADRQLQ